MKEEETDVEGAMKSSENLIQVRNIQRYLPMLLMENKFLLPSKL